MSRPTLKLGTRGSDLALTQANMVRDALSGKGVDCEIRVIRTIGDKRPDLKLSEFTATEPSVHDKGIFTKELEEALLAGDVDFAVHSLKDVPTELGEPFEICATLPRAAVSDVILTTEEAVAAGVREAFGISSSGSTGDPLSGRTVATSSVRRARMLRWLFPGVRSVDIRGNVPTRIRKLIENPDWDAIILARAGIERLGFFRPGETVIDFEGTPVRVVEMPPSRFLPAASQGAVAMEILKENGAAREALDRINDGPTFTRVTAERSFLAALQAGCQTPVGIHTEFTDSDRCLRLESIVFSDDDSGPPRTAALTIPVGEAAEAGRRLADALS